MLVRGCDLERRQCRWGKVRCVGVVFDGRGRWGMLGGWGWVLMVWWVGMDGGVGMGFVGGVGFDGEVGG